MALKKLQESKLEEPPELTDQKIAFKSMLSQTQNKMKKIWYHLLESIKQIFDIIEQENKSYINLINESMNPAESSYTDLERLVIIVEGKTLNDRNDYKKSYLMELEQTMNYWEQEIKDFLYKSKE